jgi:hypothetical protein
MVPSNATPTNADIAALGTAGTGPVDLFLAGRVARAADSLPALVGALAGAHAGSRSIPGQWCEVLSTARGVCLPFVRGIRLTDTARVLLER